MAQVLVRNLPDDVVARLKARAARARHSLEQELRDILIEAARPGLHEVLADMDRIRAMTPKVPQTDFRREPILRRPRPRMALIIDASVAIKWFIDEPGSHPARRLWREGPDRLAPDLIMPGVCNAAWRKMRLAKVSAQSKQIAAPPTRMVEFRPPAPFAARASWPSTSITRFTTASILPSHRRNRSGCSPLTGASRAVFATHPGARRSGGCDTVRGAAGGRVQTFASGRIWPPSTTIVVPVM